MGYIAAFESYRELYDRQSMEAHCLENLGITSQGDFESSLADSRGAVVLFAGSDVPILTRLVNLHDRNIALYGSLAGQTADHAREALYYSHLDRAVAYSDNIISEMTPVVRKLAASRGILAYDSARSHAERTDAEVYLLLQRIGGVACLPVLNMPAHHHYMMLLRAVDGEQAAERPLDFPALYHDALGDGTVPNANLIEVTGTLSREDCDYVAGYYDRQHALLTQSDATEAGFSPDSLRVVLTDPGYTKIAYRLDGHVANLMLLADPRSCPWIDQRYVNFLYPDQYERGRALIAIGAISDPEAPKGLTRATVAMGGRLIAYAGGNVALGIATDDVSNEYVPYLSVEILRHIGLRPQLITPNDVPQERAEEPSDAPHQGAARQTRQPILAANGVAFRSLILRPDC